jgi:hypothetical protein
LQFDSPHSEFSYYFHSEFLSLACPEIFHAHDGFAHLSDSQNPTRSSWGEKKAFMFASKNQCSQKVLTLVCTRKTTPRPRFETRRDNFFFSFFLTVVGGEAVSEEEKKNPGQSGKLGLRIYLAD